MVLGAAFAIAFSGQSDAALQRMKLLLSSAMSYRTEFTVSINKEPQVLCTWQWQKQNEQIFTSSIPQGKFELRQLADASVIIEHGDKSYQEYRRLSDGFLTPDPEGNFAAALSYPYLLLLLTDPRVPSSAFNVQVRDGQSWLTANIGGLAGPEMVEILSDAQGKPVQINRTIPMEEGPLNIVMKFTSFVGSSQPFPAPNMNPLSGYVPASDTLYYTPTPGDKLTLHSWRDKSGKTLKMSDSVKGKGFVIFITDPTCEISRKAAPELKTLCEKLQKNGWTVAELSLGAATTSFSGADLYLDIAQTVEKDWAIPSTPYFLSIKPDGTVFGAYDGWHSKSPDEAFRGLTESLEEANP